MAKMYRRWSTVDDAELLTLIASADSHAFTEFVNRYAMYVALFASRILGTAPPVVLSVAIFARIRSLAREGPRDAASVKEWVLDLALVTARDYQRGTPLNSAGMDEEERRDLARQIERNADLFQQIEDYIAHHAMPSDAAPAGRVGIARDRYRMTAAFDDPEEYE